MYDVYLEIYQLAISMPEEEQTLSTPEDIDDESMVSLASRIGRRYLWTYWSIYIFIYGFFMLPQIVLLWIKPELRSQAGDDQTLAMIIGWLVLAIFHGWITYKKVIKYHISNPTKVYKYRILSYEDIYPKRLRRRLWLWNIFPFLYLTFAIVPIITRVQYLVGTKILSKVATQNRERNENINPRLRQYTIIKNYIEGIIKSYSENQIEPLHILKKLFERRNAELSMDVQRISIILSSLGIAVSIVAFMVRDSLQELVKNPNRIVVYLIFSIVALILGVAIYFISQLQIQVRKRRNLSIVLDVIDVMLPEHE